MNATMPMAGEPPQVAGREGPGRGRREREAYADIIGLVSERSRIRLHEGKESLIQARLGVADLEAHGDWLRGPGGAPERAVPGGHLLVGHAESLTGRGVPFRCLRPSYHQKH